MGGEGVPALNACLKCNSLKAEGNYPVSRKGQASHWAQNKLAMSSSSPGKEGTGVPELCEASQPQFYGWRRGHGRSAGEASSGPVPPRPSPPPEDPEYSIQQCLSMKFV